MSKQARDGQVVILPFEYDNGFRSNFCGFSTWAFHFLKSIKGVDFNKEFSSLIMLSSSMFVQQ